MSRGVAEAAGDELRDVKRVSPAQGCQCGAYACTPCFSDMNEEEIVFDRKQHLLLPSDVRNQTERLVTGQVNNLIDGLMRSVNEDKRECRVQGVKCRGKSYCMSWFMNKLHFWSNAIGNPKPKTHDPVRDR